jgi:hypothetical protein
MMLEKQSDRLGDDLMTIAGRPWLVTAILMLVVLIYALFAAWLTWPALGSLGTAIPGNDGDAFVHLWTYNWVKDALLSGNSPFVTHRLFYPQGVELYTHNFAWLNIAMWLPLQVLVGGPAAYTLVYLMVLVLNGTSTYLLLRHLTGSEPASFLAGFIVTGWPYIITRFSQPNLIFIAFVPLSLLAMHRLIQSRRWIDVCLLGLALAGIGLSRYQMLIMSAPLLGLAAFYWLWKEVDESRGPIILQLLVSGGLALLLLAPFAGPLILFQATREFPLDILPDEGDWGDADLLGYFIPGRGAPFFGTLAKQRFPNLITRTPIGLITLSLSILGLFAKRRDKWLWLGMALLLLLLALGRVLTINGQTYFALPYAWLEEKLLLVQLIRYPSRFSALLAVPVSILAGYGLMVLLSARFSAPISWGITAVLAVLIALGYRVPKYPLFGLGTPAWYESLAAENGTFGLVTIPLTRNFDEVAMIYQLVHKKPLVEGHVSRPPREAYDFINATPFLADLRERDPVPPETADISAQLKPLAEANLPYLVIHKRFLSPDQASKWRRWMGVAPLHEDDDLLVYATGLVQGLDFHAQATETPGLSSVAGQIYERSEGSEQQATAYTHWSLEPSTARGWTACVELTNDQGEKAAETCHQLDFPPETTGDIELVRAQQDLPLELVAKDGRYKVSVALFGKDGQESGSFDVGTLFVNGEGRQFSPPSPDTPLAVDLGSTLALVGFNGPILSGQSLDLRLFWQAVQEMDISYKFFVHVYDMDSGELLAQLDTIPRDWAYPTNLWHAGEYVNDHLSIPLSNIPPGTYRVEIGVYHPDTGERLIAVDELGNPYTNNSIPLGQVIIE